MILLFIMVVMNMVISGVVVFSGAILTLRLNVYEDVYSTKLTHQFTVPNIKQSQHFNVSLPGIAVVCQIINVFTCHNSRFPIANTTLFFL